MGTVESRLKDWARDRGYLLAIGPRQVVDAVLEDLQRRKDSGQFDSTFFDERLAWVPRDPTSGVLSSTALPGTTLIMLAMPRPAHLVRFEFNAGSLDALIPPTYVWYDKTGSRVREDLLGGPLPPDFSLHPLRVPLKPIAARLGLVAYGRNNITYAPGMGSYHQLVGFLTEEPLTPTTGDIPLANSGGTTLSAGGTASLFAVGGEGADHVSAPSRLSECAKCRLCLELCPTGAVSDDRFLLRAERCLTFLNEGQAPWPDWLDESAHNSLVGCMTCQEKCPANAGRLRIERLPVSFSREETSAILAGPEKAGGELWAAITAKVAGAGLGDETKTLSRNLRALVRARAPELVREL